MRAGARAGLTLALLLGVAAAAAGQAPAAAAGARTQARALAEAGRYEEAERIARAAASPELLVTLGEVLLARGQRAPADSAFRLALAGHPSDRLVAELDRGKLQRARGARDSARASFRRVLDQAAGARDARSLVAVGDAARFLGQDDPPLFKDALRQYDRAAAADPLDPLPRVRAGDLFLEKYNGEDAQQSFREALELNPRQPDALVGLARVLEFDGRPGAADAARRALATNPHSVPAHLLLARLALEGEDFAAAEREVTDALAVDPASLDALAVLGATRYLGGDPPGLEAAWRRAAALDPRDAEFFTTAAQLGVQGRRFGGAVELARRALALDTSNATALGILGINLLRDGDIAGGRAALERAFRRDPYNVWYKNTLDLLDALKGYRETRTADFQIVISPGESELLAPYAGELAEEAYEKLAARYGYRPPAPVRLEIYPRHSDFSVRTVGLVGLGALGVTFGRVVAMDSPASRERGDFNWGSTLWHEVAHVFHLGMTDARVPRWFTEGLAVYEERRARPGWGFAPTPDFLLALKQGRLPPPSRLNDAIVRPSYPEEVVHAYYEASLVVEQIEHEHGFKAILDLLSAYKAGSSTGQAFQRVLGLDPAAFDRAFDGWLRQRFAPALSDRYAAEVDAAAKLAAQGRTADAASALERAIALFPEYAGPDNAYARLAELHEKGGQPALAAHDLGRLVAHAETAYDERLHLADLQERLGDAAGAAATLEGALYVWPYDPALHTRLATLYAGLAQWPKAVRERRALVALAPVDRAEALYQLALALYQSGDAAGARREVLHALEAAPGFEKAQSLLLRIQDAPRGASR